MGAKLKLLLLTAVLLFALTACSTDSVAGTSYTDPVTPRLTTETGWWVDTTDTVPAELLRQLDTESKAIESEGYQLGGVFFNDCASETSEVCTKFFNENGIGNAQLDNGVAICIFLQKEGRDGNKPAIWLSTGKGIEATLTDMRAGRLLDTYFVPARSEGKWQEGTVSLVQALHRFLLDPTNDEFKDPPPDYTGMVVLLIVAGIIIALIIFDFIATGGEFTKAFASAAVDVATHTNLGGGGLSGGGGAGR